MRKQNADAQHPREAGPSVDIFESLILRRYQRQARPRAYLTFAASPVREGRRRGSAPLFVLYPLPNSTNVRVEQSTRDRQ